jgi:molecular chaperone DnaJ
VPAGVQSGEVLLLRGRGLPHHGGGGRGDERVRLQIWTPQELSDEQRELFRQLGDLEGAPPQHDGKRGGFWNRVKEAFTA